MSPTRAGTVRRKLSLLKLNRVRTFGKLRNMHLIIGDLPSGNIFGVLAVAGAVRVSNLEDGADGATVLASYALQTDVVFATVLRVRVTAE